MNIVIGTAFRNSSHYLSRFQNQVESLGAHAGSNHTLRVIAVEGDSNDDTFNQLELWSLRRNVQVIKCEHGQPWFGSTEQPLRLQCLSKIGNAIFSAVKPEDDILVYVESDLLWDPHTIGSLIDMAVRRDEGFDIFAPMIFAGPAFYDIWGYRKNGERFVPFSPYHIALDGTLCELDSAGSCLIMRGEVARKCRIKNDYCLVGWCEDARAQGYRVAVHPKFVVRHP